MAVNRFSLAGDPGSIPYLGLGYRIPEAHQRKEISLVVYRKRVEGKVVRPRGRS
jgi:hypothetical protein